jgi:hypothetical protein
MNKHSLEGYYSLRIYERAQFQSKAELPEGGQVIAPQKVRRYRTFQVRREFVIEKGFEHNWRIRDLELRAIVVKRV